MNDHRIRQLAATEGVSHVEVAGLSDAQVDSAVQSMGLSCRPVDRRPAGSFSERRSTSFFRLLSAADQPDALAFTTSRQLFDAYWDRKCQDGGAATPV